MRHLGTDRRSACLSPVSTSTALGETTVRIGRTWVGAWGCRCAPEGRRSRSLGVRGNAVGPAGCCRSHTSRSGDRGTSSRCAADLIVGVYARRTVADGGRSNIPCRQSSSGVLHRQRLCGGGALDSDRSPRCADLASTATRGRDLLRQRQQPTRLDAVEVDPGRSRNRPDSPIDERTGVTRWRLGNPRAHRIC